MYEIDENFNSMPGKSPAVIIQSFTCPESSFLPIAFKKKSILQALIEWFSAEKANTHIPRDHISKKYYFCNTAYFD